MDRRFKYFTEHKSRRAAGPSVIAPGRDHYRIWIKQARHGILLDRFLHGNKKKITFARPLAADNDFLWIKQIDKIGNSNTQDATGLVKDLKRGRVSHLSQR